MKAAAVAAAKSRFLKIERSSIGARTRDSMRTKSGSRTAAATRLQMTTGSSQPEMPPLEMPNTSPVRPTTNVTVPSRSSPRCSSGLASSFRTSQPHSAPARAKGTLNQNTHCHEIETRTPPSTGPSTSPTAATMVLVPMATPSWRLGKASVTSAAALANRNAAPMPWRIRQRISWVPSAAKPGAERGQRERDEAADVGVLAAEEIGQAAGREHEHGRGDHVGEDHPDELQQAGVQLALEVGQGDDQGARVDRGQQHPEAGARQGPPLVVVVAGVDAGAAAAARRRGRGGGLGGCSHASFSVATNLTLT